VFLNDYLTSIPSAKVQLQLAKHVIEGTMLLGTDLSSVHSHVVGMVALIAFYWPEADATASPAELAPLVHMDLSCSNCLVVLGKDGSVKGVLLNDMDTVSLVGQPAGGVRFKCYLTRHKPTEKISIWHGKSYTPPSVTDILTSVV
jgi:hypothetical protein